MAQQTPDFDMPKALDPLLSRSLDDPRPVVVLTCGIAGSGKSTLSKKILSKYPSFERLSIDSYIYSNHGLYSIDYPTERYEQYQEEAEKALRGELIRLLELGNNNMILDFSFAFRTTRDEWKSLIEAGGGRWILLYLDVNEEELRRRVKARNQLDVKDGDSAYLVTQEVLERYLSGFEKPDGEGEIVLRL